MSFVLTLKEFAGLKMNDLILSINETDFSQLTIQEAVYFLCYTTNIRVRVKRVLREIYRLNQTKQNSHNFFLNENTKKNSDEYFKALNSPEDSLLNIETESVIPEYPLSIQKVSNYEYPSIKNEKS